MAIAQPPTAGRLVDRDSSAWDAENVDATLGGGADYTPSSGFCRGFYVGVTGDVTVVTGGGNTVKYQSVPAGQTIAQVFTKIVHGAGTTATGLLALT